MGLKDLFKKKDNVEQVKEEVKEVAAEVKEHVQPIASFKGGKETTEHVKPVASFKGGKEVTEHVKPVASFKGGKEVTEHVQPVASFKGGENQLETPKPAVDLMEVANKVIRGEYGNGEDRKVALEKAGFNYDEVQAKVNEILSGAKPAAAPAGLKPLEEIAKEVIRGDYGNGADRKAALEKLGYNYDEVQAKVNELLK
ncbi:MAG: hypothetical protein J6D29_05120 [Solobacterium sp.]|nr:hypothetical protein [Solobacterium sp.]